MSALVKFVASDQKPSGRGGHRGGRGGRGARGGRGGGCLLYTSDAADE